MILSASTAALRAADVLNEAAKLYQVPEHATTLVAVADAWTRLAGTLAINGLIVHETQDA